tara:strand:- start:200 stop:436 length:237 start_codon:yes stop_codon:yes gene_type:complete
MEAELALFFIGAIVFLFVFGWFKASALKMYSYSIDKQSYKDRKEWLNLLKVFLVDWIVCCLGSLITGIFFVVLFGVFH